MQRIGLMAEVAKPDPVDFGKCPTIEPSTELIAVLTAQYAQKGAAKQGLALLFLTDQYVGEALEPRQHGDERMPHGLVINF